MAGNDSNISDSWYEDTSWQNAGTREFLVSVELWCPARVIGSVRKPQLPRRTSDKRDSIGGLMNNDERRIREKPSWFRSHVNSTTVNGTWRPARCKLSEESDRCILNIYVDENILQNSIYIHLLRCTDIRPADRSIFFRSDCLGIHAKVGQKWLDSSTEEVIYLKFANSDAINTWIALLRSYAVAEIYGRNYAPQDGGLYRMWRQVYLEVSQARNLGSAKPVNDVGSSSTLATDGGDTSYDSSDMDVSCEIFINEVLCGRTAVKKGLGSAEWHEQFTFSDLPPFGDLLINVHREKRFVKPQLLGSVQVALCNVRRGEMVEGWYPLISSGQSINGTQVGEVKLKMKVDEEIVLPTASYAPLLQCMAMGNLLDLLNGMEQELKLAHVAEHVIAIAVVRNVLMRDLFELAEREVDGASPSQNTLFRGNSVLTKTMELAMNWYGRSFLELSIGPVIRRLVTERVAIEVDPARSGRGQKDQEKNVDLLVYWCNEFWNSIYSARTECPEELRRLFQHIRQLVEKKFESSNRDMRWQSVSAFCFLRFVVPAVLHPHLFGLCHGMPPPQVQRSLTLIAKVMQSLANLNPAVQKEEYMKGVKLFIKDSLPAMIDYIKEVSSPSPSKGGKFTQVSADKHDRIYVMNSLMERKLIMPTLHREALLFLPHLLDVPKHLAILTSAVVRSSRHQRSKSPPVPSESLEAFTRSCMEVEAKALKCVSQLGRLRLNGGQAGSRALPSISHYQTFSQVDSSVSTSVHEQEDRPTRLTKKRLSLRTARPSTAPSTSDSERQGSWNSALDEPPLPTSPALERARRGSDGSTGLHSPRSPANLSRNGSTDRRGSLELPRRRLPSESRPVTTDHASTITNSQMHTPVGGNDEVIPTVDVIDDGKRRRKLWRGFLPKR